jgi:ribosome-binding factor A
MGKASERRMERVKSLLLSTISEIIRDELSDPRIGIFSITEIHLARDLSSADVLVAAVGGREATEQCALVLNRAAPLIWNRLRDETDLRSVPKLKFTPDYSGEYSDQVFKLLEEVRPTLADDDVEDEARDNDHDRRNDGREDRELAG